jgi:Zn-dependent protease with chaperone function
MSSQQDRDNTHRTGRFVIVALVLVSPTFAAIVWSAALVLIVCGPCLCALAGWFLWLNYSGTWRPAERPRTRPQVTARAARRPLPHPSPGRALEGRPRRDAEYVVKSIGGRKVR